MILRYNFFFGTIVCVLAFKYHFRAFTHDLILSTSLDLLLSVPGAIPVQYSLICKPEKYDGIRFLIVYLSIDTHLNYKKFVRGSFVSEKKVHRPKPLIVI